MGLTHFSVFPLFNLEKLSIAYFFLLSLWDLLTYCNFVFKLYSRISVVAVIVFYCLCCQMNYRNSITKQIDLLLPPFHQIWNQFWKLLVLTIIVAITFAGLSQILMWYMIWFFLVLFVETIRYRRQIKKNQKQKLTIVIDPKIEYFHNWFLPYREFGKFILYHDIRGFAFLWNYRFLSKNTIQRSEIARVLKNRIIGASFGSPVWLLKFMLHFTTYVITILEGTEWTRKRYIAWLFIFNYELVFNFRTFLISYWMDFFLCLQYKRIIIEEGILRVNSLLRRFLGDFLLDRFDRQVTAVQMISTSIPVLHQTNPITSLETFNRDLISYNPTKLTLTTNFTSKESVSIYNEQGKQVLKTQLIKQTPISHDTLSKTLTKYENEQFSQFGIQTIEYVGDIRKGVIASFKSKNNLINKSQEIFFQIRQDFQNGMFLKNVSADDVLLDHSCYRDLRTKGATKWGEFLQMDLDLSTKKHIAETGPSQFEDFETVLYRFTYENGITNSAKFKVEAENFLTSASMEEQIRVMIAAEEVRSGWDSAKVRYLRDQFMIKNIDH